MLRGLAALGIGVMLGGCGGSALDRAASHGDFARLRADIAARERAGSLGNAEAVGVAKGVAAWEIARAPVGEQLARVRELRACATELDTALADRMKTRDAAGAEAALARLEAQHMSPDDARQHFGDANDAWRAVGARGLVRSQDHEARLKAYLDPAPSVRRAAMRAALTARDVRDVDPLAEAARLDPEPILRTDAVRALAAIGGRGVVERLRDLWPNADEPLRDDIVVAWADPAAWGEGGSEEIRLLVAAGRGAAAIEAAGAVLRGGRADPEVSASAEALLTRALNDGSARDRAHAIALVPSPAKAAKTILDALRAATNDGDLTIRVAALARLTESPPDRAAAVTALEALAADKDRLASAARAKLALADVGDAKIQAWLEGDLVAPEPSARLGAATALAALGRAARAAPLLADGDPSVRTRAACTLILGARATR